MIQDLFEIGDTVNLYWNNGDQILNAVITNTPRGEGDNFHLKTEDGKLFLLNTYGKTFDTMFLVKKKE
jgi:hypothetical protein